MPACAPSTPASHDPAVVTTSPFSYSFVSSPRYQTFPSRSWAYQSSVSSTSRPSSLTTSWTTVAAIPRISFARPVTVTSTRCTLPSASVSRYTQRLPGTIGQYGLSIPSTKSDGSRRTVSLPCGSGLASPRPVDGEPAVVPPRPHPPAPSATARAATTMVLRIVPPSRPVVAVTMRPRP